MCIRDRQNNAPWSKRPVLLQTHPGALRSSGAHDWCSEARKRRTEDRKQVIRLNRFPSSVVRSLDPTGCVSSSRCQIDGRRRTENRERITAPLIALAFPTPGAQESARRNLLSFRYRTWVFSLGFSPSSSPHPPPIGGARRDRTDDLMLAKHALSQLLSLIHI